VGLYGEHDLSSEVVLPATSVPIVSIVSLVIAVITVLRCMPSQSRLSLTDVSSMASMSSNCPFLLHILNHAMHMMWPRLNSGVG
jgi:hypothetical protein